MLAYVSSTKAGELRFVPTPASLVGALNAPLFGASGGRPPDLDRQGVVPPRLEHSVNPVTAEDQQAVKRSRGESDEAMDVGLEDTIVDSMNGIQEGGGAQHAKPSFRDMFIGKPAGAAAASSITELDVEVLEGDIHISDMEGTPVIRFSNRIYDMVDAKLESSVIVRLLGWAIGYNALLNRIRSLWNPSGEVALVDLDNGYYLVRFANAADVSRVLIGGPWVIYGNYLTVQPWSRNFSTDVDHPEEIVVWARLPGLPYRHYTKSMFRYIASVIGRVVKIDYNTSEGKRGRFARLAAVVDLNKPLVPGVLIDGIYQRIEYEGLPTICYSCGRYGHTDDGCKKFMEDERSKQHIDMNVAQDAPLKEKFGPWVQVSNRRSRKGSESKVVHTNVHSKSGNVKVAGSSFAVLADINDDITTRDEDMGNIDVAISDGLVAVPIIVTEDGVLDSTVAVHDNGSENSLVAVEMDGSEKRAILRGAGSEVSSMRMTIGEQGESRIVASKGVIVQEPVTMKTGTHVVVRVVERSVDLGSKAGEGRRNISGSKDDLSNGSLKLGIAKKGDRGGGPARSKQSSRQSGKIGLADWMGSLDRELVESGKGRRQQSLGGNKQVTEKVDVQWRENDSFVSLKQVSGRKADLFIARHDFPCSYRVEASCFSGGIWLLWKSSVSFDVLVVSNQYIHALCRDTITMKQFLITCVYARPTERKRDELWSQLRALQPSGDIAWVLGGDFNSILSADERMGGSCRRDEGPRFTWKHETLHQRLDRCVDNDGWWTMWPHSRVLHLGRLGSDHRPILLVTDSSGTAKQNPSFKYLAAWQSHDGFEDMLAGSWQSDVSIVKNITNFQDAASRWNHESFGHIMRQKHSLVARIRGIECANEASLVPSFVDLEEQLKSELDEVLRQEEVLWFLRSRTDWIADGDRNTKYYHRITKAKHHRRICEMIKLEDGLWYSDPVLIRDGVVRHFKNVFMSSSTTSWGIRGRFRLLSTMEIRDFASQPCVSVIYVYKLRSLLSNLFTSQHKFCKAMATTAAEEDSHIRVDVPLSCDQLDGSTRSRLRRPYGSKDLISLKAASRNGSHGSQSHSKDSDWWVVLNLAFQSIGVVYGDLGTSPLYTYTSTFSNGIKHRDDVLGVLSLVLYTLTLLPLIKYVFVVLQATDNGEVSLVPNQQVEDHKVSNYKLELPSKRLRLASVLKSGLENSRFAKIFLLLITMLGTSMVIGDSVLTPCISVLSAVGGVKEATSALSEDMIAGISIVILVFLFMIQRFGTSKVGYAFAPVLCIWFILIAGIGFYNILKHDITVLKAINPMYIVHYFIRNKRDAWISLGGVVLCTTGGEALFADVGHFSVRSIQLSMCSLVYPSLILAYTGQSAYLLHHPDAVSDAFFKAVPGPMFWPMFIVSIVAAVIASQAMISGTFSIVHQSLSLGCFPRVKVVHTSASHEGQVYIPEINYLLMFACVAVTFGFKTTVKIGNAYGIAVVFVMTLTSSLLVLIMIMIWKTNIFLVILYAVTIGSVELLYLSSVLYKFTYGGYLPLAFSAFLMTVMYVWNSVYRRKYFYELNHKISSSRLKEISTNSNMARIPGLAMFYSELVQGIPPIFEHYVSNVPALHSVIVFVSMKSLHINKVPPEERYFFRRVEPREVFAFQCVVRYGYNDVREEAFEETLITRLKEFIQEETLLQIQTVSANGNMAEGGSELDMEIIERNSEIANANQTEVERLREIMAQELDQVERAWEEGGIVHLIGQTEVIASKEASIMKRILIDYAYNLLKRNLRQSETVFNIPHKHMLKVGMTYEL
ncbi:hypothetical protein GQ457_06G029840 [Hibiscus cannabinus]